MNFCGILSIENGWVLVEPRLRRFYIIVRSNGIVDVPTQYVYKPLGGDIKAGKQARTYSRHGRLVLPVLQRISQGLSTS